MSRLGAIAAFFIAWCSSTLAYAGSPEASDSVLNDPGRRVAIRLHAELGFLSVLSHRLKLGSDATYVDLRSDLGQDTLFPFGRLSADVDIGRSRQHTVTFLYQPLNLETQAVSERDLRVEDVTFDAGTPLNFRYSFPFYRVSYLYDILPGDAEVGFGGSLQIRNARLEYSTQDGSTFRGVRDVGPVPVIKFRGRGFVAGNFWLGGEVDGFYAPIRYINGGRSDVEGAILDASFRAGLAWNYGVDTFLNLRWIAGGARGTSSDPDPLSDGFNSNWLHFLSVSVGVSLR
ncbi:MAG: hypothetical protein ACE37F_13600 [Nannocystaceae bacterium]|nr:hypothetical protein [bacterium]